MAVACLLANVGCSRIDEPQQPSPAVETSGGTDGTPEPVETPESESDGDVEGAPEPGSLASEGGDTSDSDDQPGDAGGAASGSPNRGNFGADSEATPVVQGGRFATPTAAERYGRQAVKKAKKASDPAKAAAIALDGWREASRFPAHAGCRDLASELLADIKQYDAEMASTTRGRPIRGLPLKIR